MVSDRLSSGQQDFLPVGGSRIDMVYGIHKCACLLGCYFAKFGIAIGGFSSEMKEPKLHRLGVFLANYGENTRFEQNWALFFRKWYIDGWVIVQKIGMDDKPYLPVKKFHLPEMFIFSSKFLHFINIFRAFH